MKMWVSKDFSFLHKRWGNCISICLHLYLQLYSHLFPILSETTNRQTVHLIHWGALLLKSILICCLFSMNADTYQMQRKTVFLFTWHSISLKSTIFSLGQKEAPWFTVICCSRCYRRYEETEGSLSLCHVSEKVLLYWISKGRPIKIL